MFPKDDMEKIFTIPADYGCLAILAPDSYETFINENWDLEQLKSHIILQNQNKSIVPWGCVDGNWIVKIIDSDVNLSGDRVFISQVETSGQLLLTTYESITMAAQFKEVSLPQDHETDQVFEVAPGRYIVKVVQTFKTSVQESEKVFNQTEPHFIVLLIKTDKQVEHLDTIPWFSA
jgi:hypothetical protein